MLQLRRAIGILGISYLAVCGLLFAGQRRLIFRPSVRHETLPNDLGIQYQEVWISVGQTGERLHGWWIPMGDENYRPLKNEPSHLLPTPKTILYFVGVGRNKGDYNYLARVEAFKQLGFDVLMIDYRGYGKSDGAFPNETQLYEDAEATWQYATQYLKLSPSDIWLYGESLGGAIALDLALNHPEAEALILQSSFTSMTDAVQTNSWYRILPVDALLTQRFESIQKIGELQIPILILHGTDDSIVPVEMGQALYEATISPKMLFLISWWRSCENLSTWSRVLFGCDRNLYRVIWPVQHTVKKLSTTASLGSNSQHLRGGCIRWIEKLNIDLTLFTGG